MFLEHGKESFVCLPSFLPTKEDFNVFTYRSQVTKGLD